MNERLTSALEISISEFYKKIETLAKTLKRQTGLRIEAALAEGVYGIPRGGIPVAMALSEELKIPLLSDPIPGCLVVDDVVDSGKTLQPFLKKHFTAALHLKSRVPQELRPDVCTSIIPQNTWINYWWEKKEKGTEGVQDNITRILQYIGEDPSREGLKETPGRVMESFNTLYGGYKEDPKSIIKTFSDSEGYDEIVLLKNIEMYSTCEHHMLPFFGKCHIAYIPGGKVIGISKLARLMEVFSRRLQIQERIGQQITRVLMEELQAQAAACIIEAQHFCMTSRGIQKQNSIMTTSSMKGLFLTESAARVELMRLIR